MATAKAQGAAILVVEDENIVAMDIRNSLRKLGYRVTGMAGTGVDALAKAEADPPDLVLMDVNLRGDMDGIVVGQKLRARRDVPIIYLTAYSDPGTVERARIAEPFGYLIKPFEERELEIAIEMALYRDQLEKALRASERRLDATLRSIGDAVLATDEKGRITFINAVAAELLSTPADQAMKRPFSDLFTSDPPIQLATDPQTAGTRAIAASLVTGGAPQPGVPGFSFPIEGTLTTISEGDRITGYVMAFRDISERQRAQLDRETLVSEQAARVAVQEAHRQAQFLADAGRELAESLDYHVTLRSVARLSVPAVADWCVIHMREEGKIRLVAAAHREGQEALLIAIQRRHPPDPDLPHGYSRVLRTGETDLLPLIDEALLHDLAFDDEDFQSLQKLGLSSQICVPLHARREIVGALTLATGASRRFTSGDVRLAEELARNAGLAIDNARLYGEAQAAVHIRDEFLTIASHELKTPMTSLQLELEGARRNLGRLPQPIPPRDLEKLGRAVEHMRRLTRLVGTLLDVAQIRAGRLSIQLEDFDLRDVVTEVMERFESLAKDAGCELSVSQAGEATGRWDRVRLDQVLTNLVGNAIKYGRGKPVEIALTADALTAALSVRDHGIGIPAAARERIFEPFERAVSSQNYGGLGLGLYITRQIVDAHQGTIHLHSEPTQGSTFTVKLPRRPPTSKDPELA